MLNHHGGNLTKICSTYGIAPEDILDFSANINPLGYPSEIENIIISNLKTILSYPDPDCCELRKLLAAKHSCDENNIIVGNGSTELFYLIPRTISANRGIVFQPTFTEFTRALSCAGTNVEDIVCDEGDSFRINPMKVLDIGLNNNCHVKNSSARTFQNILFFCNPNNPTGQLVQNREILHIAGLLPDSLIVVDEAFMEFIPEPDQYSVISCASEIENLVVVRSLTKLFGIPGLRLGFLVAHHKTANMLLAYKEPWSVNSFAQFAGNVAINNKEFVKKSHEYTNNEKNFLYEEISKIDGLYAFEPSVNFILLKITDGYLTASALNERLIKYGIVIRNCANFTGLSEKFIRVAVRTHDENIKLLVALNEVIRKTENGIQKTEDSGEIYGCKGNNGSGYRF